MDEYLLLWKGQQTGPFNLEQIREKLRVGEISRIHQIGLKDDWQLLDEFLEASREADLERQRVEEQKRREADLERQRAEEQRRREEDLKRRHEAQLAEEHSRRGPKTQPLQQSAPQGVARPAEASPATAPSPASSALPAPPSFTPTLFAPAAPPPGGAPGQAPGGYPPSAFAPPSFSGAGAPRTYGAPPPPFFDAPSRTSGLAVASLVMGLCCFIPFVGAISWILALIFGHVALSRMKSDPSLRGRGLAIAGLVITYVLLALTVLIVAVSIILGKPFYNYL